MDLNQLRDSIDAIDGQLAQLFTKRMHVSADIAQYKKEHNMGVMNKSRERQILNRMLNQAEEDLETYTKVFFSTLFDLSRSYQNSLISTQSGLKEQIEGALANTPDIFPKKGIVACQGVEGAYSQVACDKLFSNATILYFKNFEGVFSAVEKGLCEYGMLPIENSSYGSVNEVYDLMRYHHFHIVRSIKLRVSHGLLTKPDTDIDMIREIFSHEQAIGQCSEFLKMFPNVKITACENTAAAAKMVADMDRTDVAAISSLHCAELYGLKILKEDIQNADNNYTRFICISKEMEIYPGASKISLLLTVAHTPGALSNLLVKISSLDLNISKLESRPIMRKNFEFVFYFDIDASIYSPEVIRLLCELDQQLELFMFLGSYIEV